ncbi:MAG: HlyD family efflux transporter periplasmic adaptor subunit [Phycisphaeraceae bacterium]|nr:HlyD family efflux transporter periplasmic adaptor subunit [Phycisphaeraceae bacterium]MCW5769221.1 HlyD family efflux transporter periplasmic adaptor subunit [Phycisphaeraceae bacterium]
MMNKAKQKRRGRRLVVAGLCAAAVMGSGLIMAGANSPSRTSAKGSKDDGLTADLAIARVQSFDITTTASGELQAKNQIEIRSQLESQSTITEVVNEGSLVKKGDLLIRLKSDNIQTQIDEEMLRVESARAELVAAENSYEIQLSENESKTSAAQLKLDLARLTLEQWTKGDVEKQRQQLDLAIEKGERDLARLREKFERSEELFQQGFLSKNERDIDEIAQIEAEANLKKTMLEREIYWSYTHPKDQRSRQSDVDQAEAELDRVKRQNEIQLTSRDADRLNKRRQKTVREQRLAKLEQQFAACEIVAPSDGLVVFATSIERNRWGGGGEGPLQIGREVFPNMLLIVLPDTSSMVASVRVHESLAGRIRPGQRANVTIDALGGRALPATVESIGVMAETGGFRDPNLREYTVRALLDPSDLIGELKPAMRCEATITMGRVENALTIPLQAIFTDGAVRMVYVPRGNKYVKVPVAVGRRSDIFAEITGGISEGTRVLLREPAPGEVLNIPWDDAQLTAAGYKREENGEIVPIAPAFPAGIAMNGMMPEGAAAMGAGGGARSGGAGGMPALRREAPASGGGRPRTQNTSDDSNSSDSDSASSESSTSTPRTGTSGRSPGGTGGGGGRGGNGRGG